MKTWKDKKKSTEERETELNFLTCVIETLHSKQNGLYQWLKKPFSTSSYSFEAKLWRKSQHQLDHTGFHLYMCKKTKR